jgi:hypothetical protein
MIIIINITKESFSIFDSQIQRLPEMIGYYHENIKQTIRIIVHFKEFKVIQKVIQQSIGKWNSMLDHGNVRVTGFPNLVLVSADKYYESEASQVSGSSFLTLTSFTIFQNDVPAKTTFKEPVSEVTVESYKATIEMQNKKIDKQEAQIEFLIQTIQQLNSDMNHKFERMLHLITHQPSEVTHLALEMLKSSQRHPPNSTTTESKAELISQPPKKTESRFSR